MSGLTQSPSTVDLVGDLRNRIAELEQECGRLRQLTGDAAICRASPSSDSHEPALEELRSLAILDAVPLPTCYVDANLRSLFANKAFRARFGAPEGPARSKGLGALIGDALFERVRAQIDQALSGREVSVVVAAPSDKHGRCKMTFVPDRSSGNAVDGLLVTACGVSDDKRGQRALQRTQDLFERTEHAAGLGYLEWRADTGRCVSCSRGLKRLLGLDDEVRMTARRFLDAVHPEDRRLYRGMTKRHHRAGKRYEIDYRIIRSDGTIVEVREVGEPMPGPNGGTGHWLACVQDISAQREKESELRRSEEKYRDLIVGLIEGIAIARDQKILFANQALAEIFGFDAPEELVAIESTDALIAPHERARLKDYRDARMRGEPVPTRYIAQYLRKDGTPLWLESSVRVVDWVGGPALQTTLIDITQRVEAEQALRASEQRFKDFAEASSDWFWEMGPDLRFTWFSSAILKGTERHSRDLLGRPSWEIDPRWPDAEDARQHRADLEAHRPFKDYRYPVHLDSGEVVHVSVSGIPVFAEDGGFRGYRGTAADITAQARAEQEAVRAHALLADAIESIDDGFLLYDRDDRLVMVNQYGRKRFPEISDLLELGTRWEDLIWAMVDREIVDVPEEQRDVWVREHREVHRRGGARYHQLADGRWLELRDHRTRDGGCAVVGTNVTELKHAEAALKESEQQFRDFAEASSDWFWEMGPDLRFTRFSGQRSDIATHRLVGKTWRALGKPDGAWKDARGHRANLEAHKPFRDFRYRLAESDGGTISVRVSGVPVFDIGGAFRGYRGTATDITAQVRAEQEAVRAREMLADAVESVDEGFAMFDRQDRLVLSNEGHLKLLAPIWDEIAPNPTWETMFRAQVDRGLTKAPAEDLDTWIRQQLDAHHRGPWTRQLESVDGHVVEVRSYPTRDGGFAAVGRDITALKRAEEALRQSEQRFKDFAESASDWFWEMGPDLRFTWFSNQYVDGIGRTRPENAKVPVDTPEWRAHLADLEAHRPFKDFRYLGLDFDGTEMYASVSGVPVFDGDGTFLGYRGTASNITAEVQAEHRAARAQALLVDAIESVGDGFLLYDREDHLLLVNENCRKALPELADVLHPGVTREELLRTQLARGLVKVPAGQQEAWVREQLDIRRGALRYQEMRGARWIELRDHPTRDGGCVTLRTDVTELKRAEQALRESEQRFKDFAEASSDWFWEMGADLRFSWFSHELPGNTGRSAADLIGQTRRVLGESDADQGERRAHLADLEARRPFKDFRYGVVDAHGRKQYLSVSGVPVFGADNSFLGYRGTGKNVTAEVLAEQRAARAQDMLTDAIESIREGFAMYDKQDRLVLYNTSFRASLGPFWESLGPDPSWQTMFRAIVEHGVVKAPDKGREAWIRDHIDDHRTANSTRQFECGDDRWMEVREYPTRDGGLATVRADITALKRTEEALKASEQRFKDFAEASSDWFWEMGPDMRFSWFSHHLLKGTGIRSRSVIGKTRPTLGRSDVDAEKWRAHEATLKARQPFRDFRYRMCNEAGEDVYLSISGVPMLGPDGAFLGYRGAGKNITAEVLAEQRAAKAQATLHDAIESIAGGFALFDKHDRLVLCNESYRESLAEIADQIVPGVSWEALCYALMESGNLKIGAEDREAWMQEQISLHRKLGCTRCYETVDGRWLEVREYPTSDGGIAVIRADITALKQAETAVRESEALLKQAARMANLGHWVWDEQTDRCLYYSDEVARIYDLSAEELASYDRMEKVLADLHPEDRDRYQEAIADAKRNAEPYQVEYRELASNGEYRYMRERGEPFFDEAGRHVRTLGILQDITEDKQIETALKESESLLKQAAQMADLGHWVWDEQADRCILCSESLAQIYGMTTDQYMASLGTTDIVHVVHPEDRQHYQEVIRQALEFKTGYDVEFRERLADGSVRHMRERGEPVLNEAGQLVRTVGIAQDITKHKQIETALKESESLLKHAAQIADLGHWVWDEQVDRCIHCSEGLAWMYGMTPEEYIAKLGAHPLTLQTVLEEDKERYDEVIRRAIQLKKSYDIEFRERLADGSVRHMRERGEPVLNEAGQLVRTVGILQDITKHKRAEEAIRRARDELEMRVEERTAALRTANRALRREIVKHERTEEALRQSRGLLEAIIEAAAMGINVKGPDLRYVFMNRYQATVYGVSSEQAVGKTPGELINSQYGAYVAGLDRGVLEAGETMPYFEEEIRDKDGLLRTWLTTKVPVKDNHDVLRYIVTASLDVTELKARERELKQAQKMDAVGKLTGGIAHDFNNLLFVVRGNVALLKDEIGDSGTARECLGAIHDAASLGADLTRSLLAFSRQQPLEPTVVDLSEIVAHTVATLLRPLEKNIEIETGYPKQAWPVLIDSHRLENALLNLALNARDAMPEGGRLRISVENRRSSNGHTKRSYDLPPGEYVCLVIADSGVGMPPDLIERVFEPFFTTKPAGAGTGLGLSMVYGFIKQSGGYIDIESKLGQGTTITMHLPRTADVEEQQAASSDERRWIARGRETILVTEDDAAVRRVAVRILTKLGYQTREATNGAEALEVLEQDPSIDLLFADIVLTGSLNGAQLAREAQARRPNLKVLFASGYSQPAVLRDTEGADAVPLLSKPYDADELGKLVRRVLDETPETAPEATRARLRRRKKR